MRAAAVVAARAVGAIDFPVPPDSSMRKTSSTSLRHYYVSGIQCYMPILTMALQKGIDFDSSIKILDFGCGVGRQLLHFTQNHPTPSYYACDVDDTSVDFIAKNYPRVNSHASKFTPPLRYADGQFDMVYSVSTFSHLNMDDQVLWLNEMARITKPGGYCFLTTEGAFALQWLHEAFGRSLTALREELSERGWLYKEYPDFEENRASDDILKITSVLRGIERSYGHTVLSTDYIRENWNTPEFEVTDILEGLIDLRQDLIVLRRN
jgi:ubiquinone/menaquinone biosynthesis C-methylase UbiE